MKIKFWGTRGSIPVNGKEFCKYGGNTSSVEILPSENISFILDAGSGIRNAGIDIIKRKEVEKFIDFSPLLEYSIREYRLIVKRKTKHKYKLNKIDF